ncbi:helix-turn-helix domain-containing protein [Halorussus pelagicus]|uniref:helix-turn-helix domain-containing protein n=1 Tax=Halorussus pelagicus TaxID=2505977 RepID=UPI0037447D8D
MSAEEELDVDEEGDLTEEVNVEVADEEELSVETDQDRLSKGRERLEEEADRAVDQFDQGIVDLLSWVLDTETRARIYVYLRQHPHSTSEEIAEGTGLYPSTVRESLAELHDEEKVERRKRESEGAGNNPYEYTAIAPSDLVGGIAGQIQDELNTVFNLDDHLDTESETRVETEPSEPVSIRVEDEESADGDDEAEHGREADSNETSDDESDDTNDE